MSAPRQPDDAAGIVSTDIAIVGAGPIGLALALALARRGIRTVVLDGKERLDEHSRATLLPPRALETLAAVGVLPELVAAGQVNPALDIRRPGDLASILRFDFDAWSPVTAVPYALAIPQDRTERVLLAAAERRAGIDVRFGERMTELRRSDGVAEVQTATGTVVRAAYVVGADGAHSRVREELGLSLSGTTYPTRAVLADVDVAPQADLARGWLADPRARSFTLAIRIADAGSRSGGRWRIIESSVAGDPGADDLDRRARRSTERMFGPGAWRATAWTAAYRKHERRVERMHSGRVVLAGDAAHLTSPAGGQGLVTGLGDVHALAWRLDRLVRGESDPGVLLESYSAERLGYVDAEARPLTDGLERMETLPPWARSLAFSAVGLLRRSPLPREVTRRLSALDPGAASSAVLIGDDPVGRRMPDVPLGGGRRLYELMGRDGLLLGPASAIESPSAADAAALGGVPSGIAVAAMPPLPAGSSFYRQSGPSRPRVGHWLFVRPDHLVAALAPDAPGVVAAAHRALGSSSARVDAIPILSPADPPT